MTANPSTRPLARDRFRSGNPEPTPGSLGVAVDAPLGDPALVDSHIAGPLSEGPPRSRHRPDHPTRTESHSSVSQTWKPPLAQPPGPQCGRRAHDLGGVREESADTAVQSGVDRPEPGAARGGTTCSTRAPRPRPLGRQRVHEHRYRSCTREPAVTVAFLLTTLVVVANPRYRHRLHDRCRALTRDRAAVVAAFGCTIGGRPHMAAAIHWSCRGARCQCGSVPDRQAFVRRVHRLWSVRRRHALPGHQPSERHGAASTHLRRRIPAARRLAVQSR